VAAHRTVGVESFAFLSILLFVCLFLGVVVFVVLVVVKDSAACNHKERNKNNEAGLRQEERRALSVLITHITGTNKNKKKKR
jgi:Na+-transporting methylmalonyl-CoA/oxaloacetate decarboxylase gamma subunit